MHMHVHTHTAHAVASFDQELFLHGNKRGRVRGRIAFDGLPRVIHAVSGVHSERGLEDKAAHSAGAAKHAPRS